MRYLRSATLIVAAAVVPRIAVAQGEMQPLTLETMVENVNLFDVHFAPDSRQLLFVSDRSGQPKLWLMNPDGSEARMLVDDDGTESSPAWSRTGSGSRFCGRGRKAAPTSGSLDVTGAGCAR